MSEYSIDAEGVEPFSWKREWPFALVAPAVALLHRIPSSDYAEMVLNGDGSLVNLMSHHHAQGLFQGPAYFYGQAYNGTVEAFVAGRFFAVLGSSVWAMGIAQAFMSALTLLVLYRLCYAVGGRTGALLGLLPNALGTMALFDDLCGHQHSYQALRFFGTLLVAWGVPFVTRPTTGRAALLGVLVGISVFNSLQIIAFLVPVLALLYLRGDTAALAANGELAARLGRRGWRVAVGWLLTLLVVGLAMAWLSLMGDWAPKQGTLAGMEVSLSKPFKYMKLVILAFGLTVVALELYLTRIPFRTALPPAMAFVTGFAVGWAPHIAYKVNLARAGLETPRGAATGISFGYLGLHWHDLKRWGGYTLFNSNNTPWIDKSGAHGGLMAFVIAFSALAAILFAWRFLAPLLRAFDIWRWPFAAATALGAIAAAVVSVYELAGVGAAVCYAPALIAAGLWLRDVGSRSLTVATALCGIATGVLVYTAPTLTMGHRNGLQFARPLDAGLAFLACSAAVVALAFWLWTQVPALLGVLRGWAEAPSVAVVLGLQAAITVALWMVYPRMDMYARYLLSLWIPFSALLAGAYLVLSRWTKDSGLAAIPFVAIVGFYVWAMALNIEYIADDYNEGNQGIDLRQVNRTVLRARPHIGVKEGEIDAGMASYWYGYRATLFSLELSDSEIPRVRFRPWPRTVRSGGKARGDPDLYQGFIDHLNETIDAGKPYAIVFNLTESYGDQDYDTHQYNFFCKQLRLGRQIFRDVDVVPVFQEDNWSFGDFWIYIVNRPRSAKHGQEAAANTLDPALLARIKAACDERKVETIYARYWQLGFRLGQLYEDPEDFFAAGRKVHPWPFEQRERRRFLRARKPPRDVAYVIAPREGNPRVDLHMQIRIRKLAEQGVLTITDTVELGEGRRILFARWNTPR